MSQRAVALGTFDGVHLGHAALIGRMREQALEKGLSPLIYTFTNHPMAAFGACPPLLMTNAARIEALGRLAEVAADEFTPAFAQTTPRAFVEMLVSRFNMRHVAVGYNYTFGSRGAGNIALLRALGEEFGFTLDIVPPVLFEGEPLSSTRIRATLEAGGVKEAREMLGRPYLLTGTVVKNRGIGRQLGFPTANLAGIEGLVLPADGVYATYAHVRGTDFPAVTNVGSNPTVGGEKVSVETHLIGFADELYDETLGVSFMQHLRGEEVLDGLEALRARIAADVRETVEVLKIR